MKKWNVKRILFLDIDGVLNSRKTCVAFNRLSSPFCVMKKVDKGEPVTFKDTRFDPTCVGLLKKIIKLCEFHVVMSSTWRRTLSHEAVIEMFKVYDLDLTDLFLGHTPIMDYNIRGVEIDTWLKDNDLEGIEFCILDDDQDMTDKQKKDNFVQTTMLEGLSLDNYNEIVSKYSNEKVYW